MTEQNVRRLPENVCPISYRLSLRPDLGSFTFRGEEHVDIQVMEPSESITLNAAELKLLDAHLMQGMKAFPAKEIKPDEESETVTLSFDREVPPGPATLVVKFSGVLNDQLRGFYRSQCTDPHGDERFLASTQFEATDARRAFPCWDEPTLKATFQVTLVVPSDLTAVSNTQAVDVISMGDGYKAVKFAETPKMSTYLLAFVVGDLASVEATAPSGTQMRVWATRGNEDLGRFALDTSLRLLDYYNDYFGIPYPLDKLDHLAIPDFAAGAMENWGAITYREVALLHDPRGSSAATRQRIVEIIAHEMAHMWFGDLVTMAWWDDLWLNESFASWMGNKATAHLYPEWSMWTQFLSQDTGVGMKMDGLRNSHPIEARVKDPAEIRELFDAISYSKGAAILWMLEQFLGEETFRQGLRGYLSEHQYGNARTEDLWKALDKASGQPVTALMDSWVKQTGFPVVRVKTRRQGAEVRLDLSQERFLYDHIQQVDEAPTLWKVPIGARRAGGGEVDSLLMEESQASMTLAVGASSGGGDWIKVNAGQTGFFRVDYAAEEMARLRSAVVSLELPPTDRLGLQSDAFALMRAGFASATDFLEMAGAYKREVDATVWSDLSANLLELETLLADEPFLPQFHAYGRELYREIVQRTGWDPGPEEGHLEALRRGTVLGQMGSYGDKAVLDEARVRFDEYLKDPDHLRPDLRGLVFGLVGRESDRSTYDVLWDLEKKASLQEEKRRLLAALARPKSKELLEETLERALSSEVRSQDAVLVIVRVAANRNGRDLAWEFIKGHWEELDRRYGKGGFMLMRLVGATEAFTTPDRADEVEEFFETHPAPSAQRTIQQSLEAIRLNVKWLEMNREDLAGWLAARR